MKAEDIGKQNPKESCKNNYQKHIACSYGCKLVYVSDKFSKLNCINSIVTESKYCNDVTKKRLKNVMAIKILKTLLNIGSGIMIMLIMMLK